MNTKEEQLLREKKENEKKIILGDFPFTISIESSSFCNLKCIMCENPNMKRKKGNMEYVLFQKIADEVSNYPKTRVYLSGYGEPLLNEHIVEFIKYATSAGVVESYMNTNAMLLDENISERIIDAGLHCLIVSLDGFTKETYESIRVGADRDTVYRNVEKYINILQKRGQKDQMVEVQFIDMKETESERETWMNYWMSLGASIKLKPFLVWGAKEDDSEKNINSNFKNRMACEICNEFMAMWNGDAATCSCGDVEVNHIVGNIYEKSIKELWEIKKDTFSGYHVRHEFQKLPNFCQVCNNWMVPFAKHINS